MPGPVTYGMHAVRVLLARNPERVRRVTPPSTTMAKTSAQTTSSQMAMARREFTEAAVFMSVCLVLGDG